MKSRLRTRTHRVMSSASSNSEMPPVPEGRALEEPLVSQSLNETKLQRNLPFFNRFTTDAETFAATNGHATRSGLRLSQKGRLFARLKLVH